MQTYKYTSVLTIAGSDSGGGAGIQADLKTFSALGCYGTSAITAVTAQNTLGVWAVHPVPAEIITAQITAVMDDIRPSAIKVGMLPDADTVRSVVETLRRYKDIPIIVDPVMVSSSGTELVEPDASDVIRNELFPLARLVTPNVTEASMFTGEPVSNVEQMKKAATQLLKLGSYAILVKSGDLEGEDVVCYYADQTKKELQLSSSRIQSRNTHGTGCTLSSAIAAYLAKGKTLEEAIKLGQKYVHIAIAEGKHVKMGAGTGSLNHFFNPRKLARIEIKRTINPGDS